MLKEETIKLFITKHFQEEKTRLSSEALSAFTKLLELYVDEALNRANEQARLESMRDVSIEHLEKILPQLMLDF